MPRLARPNHELFYRNAQPREKEYLIADGEGLNLLVDPSGRKFWIFRYRFERRPRKLRLGRFPRMTLKQARQRAEECRSMHAQGQDPAVAKRAAQREAAVAVSTPSLCWVVDRYAADHLGRVAPRTRKAVMLRLEKHILPSLGALDIDAISSRMLLDAVRTIDAQGKHHTAHRILAICARIWKYARLCGFTKNTDIATDLRGALPPARATHRAALTEPQEFARLLRCIESWGGGWYATRYALRLLPHVFTRPGELREAKWEEFDFEQAQWVIPAERTKMRRPHLVPLSKPALELLAELKQLSLSDTYLFPGPRYNGKPISEATLLNAIRSLGFSKEEMTAHGFRAIARTIGEEQLGFNPMHLEAQLGHKVPGPLGNAYNRSTYLPERRRMMEEWSRHLMSVTSGT